MSQIAFFISGMLEPEMARFFDIAVKSAALLMAASLCALALWRASAATRHFIWALGIVAVLVVPVLSGILPEWRALPVLAKEVSAPAMRPQIRERTAGEAQKVATTALVPASRSAHIPPVTAKPPVALPPEVSSSLAASRTTGWRDWVQLIWAAGAALLFARLIAARLLLRRAVGRCRVLRSGDAGAGDRIYRSLEAMRSQLGVRTTITVLMDGKRTIPVVWGIFRARLMLPADARSWDEQQLRSVLAHELGHIRRGDLVMQWLTEIARALYWFNPLVWLAAHRLYAERERACDDLVLASGVLPSAYAGHLLHVASSLPASRWMHACGLAMARQSSLEGRLQAVINNRQNRREMSPAMVTLGLTLFAALIVPISMLQAADEKKEVAPRTTESASKMGPVTSVITAEDSAEISVEQKPGEIAFVVGEGPQARVLLHAFGSSSDPVIFRAAADDRQGKWWEQARVFRKNEGEALFPELPADWLPRGRVGFLPAPAKQADESIVFAEIHAASGKVPLAVRPVTASDKERAANRGIPKTTPDSQILFDCRIHPIASGAPERTIVLPVMAAADLTGSPRSALYYPYITLRPGIPGSLNMGSRGDEVKVMATRRGNGIQVDGTILLRFTEGKFPSAKAAKDETEKFIRGASTEPPLRKLEARISARLGGNDSLVIPIASGGLFPETLVASMTVHYRRVRRARWQPPEARGPIQLDGWVFTWPRAKHEWFSKNFDYDGLPSMIVRKLKERKEFPSNSTTSEAVDMLQAAEVDQLLAAVRKQDWVSVSRVEPFSAKQNVKGWSNPEDRTHFSADGEGATVLPRTDGSTVSLNLQWDKPVLRHMSGSDPYGLNSGSSICMLLPGPADPEKIRMLVLRCIDPDAVETR